MSFYQLNSTVWILFLVLSATLVLIPEIIYWLFAIQGNELGDFLAKRAGALFLGLSILCFCSRNSNSKDVIRVVSLSVGVAMSAMALLGLYELIRGFVGLGMLVAVGVEIIIATQCLRLWSHNRPG